MVVGVVFISWLISGMYERKDVIFGLFFLYFGEVIILVVLR